jgi:3,4-dihydroxy 2-butanone 4-phosphate synthase/GTP cyclohydrolase II
LTNNPKKVIGLEGYGLTIVERVGIEMEPTDENRRYLTTKKEKLGHLLGFESCAVCASDRGSDPARDE